MKTRGWIDLYLPRKLAFHLKIVLASVLIAIFFNTAWTGKPFNENFLMMLGSLIIQLEIFMYLAMRIFASESIKSGKQYKKLIIIKLIKFYLTVLIIAIGFLFITMFIQMLMNNQRFSDIFQQFIQNGLINFVTSWLIGIALGSLLFFYFEWNASLQREQKLREEKLIFQYETLKNQVNPHFLFNSLNTLSSLVSKDARLSEKFIARFSSIYRYILENRDKDLVPLENELDFVRDYYFLQKIRDDGKIQLDINIEEANKYEILPISLQLLIENALKHNAATKESPLKIEVSNKNDHLMVKNNLEPKMRLEPSSKLGLKNLKERVKLVMNREVLVSQSSGQFIVKMPIKSK